MNQENIDSLLKNKQRGFWPIFTDPDNADFALRAMIIP